MTYGLFEAGPFGQKPIQISVRGESEWTSWTASPAS